MLNQNGKVKILFAGVGGVGGFFGGVMASHFYSSEKVNIYFLARGEHLNKIKNHGLKVIQGDITLIAQPTLATNNASEIGFVDYIIISSKSPDLELMIHQLRPCIQKGTILLPLLNGVDSVERIRLLVPYSTVLHGCTYILSRLKEPGVIENKGVSQTIHFGLDNNVTPPILLLERLFNEANIKAKHELSISSFVWKKFIFISPIAVATSYYDCPINLCLVEGHKLETLTNLIKEAFQIAQVKGIDVSPNIVDATLDALRSLPAGVTSSLHSDFQIKRAANELLVLAGYVIEEGNKFNLRSPTYETLFGELSKQIESWS